jgi:alpha-tubulin suppressor-like RCC1 family protein
VKRDDEVYSLADRRTTRTPRKWPVVILAALLAATTMAIAAPAQAHEPYIAKAWGWNAHGQLGNGTHSGPEECTGTPCGTTPLEVSALSRVAAVAGGGESSLALLEAGTVMAWGDNFQGELGNGTTESHDVPVPVCAVGTVGSCTGGPYLSEVTAIAADVNYSHNLALLKSGTVVAWGEGREGQLGNGTSERSDVPVAVTGLTEVVAIAAGNQDSFALLKNGEVRAWGQGTQGQLGNGTTKGSDVPVAVTGLTEAVAIAAGQEDGFAVLKDGTVMAWGTNNSGRLGNGTETKSDVPVKVSGLKEVKAIAAGDTHTLALLKNGTVMAWGKNEAGELGDGTSTGPETCGETLKFPCSEKPVAVCASGTFGGCASGPYLTEVTAIAAGDTHSLALLANGTAMAWGKNKQGQLGDATSTGPEPCTYGGPCSTTPVAVSRAGFVKGISAGYDHSLAVVKPPPTVAAVNPQEGPKPGGTTVTITGAEFEEAIVVKFGSATATQVKVSENGTKITAVSPAGSGTVDVTVTTPAGTSPTSAADKFDYERPTVKKLAPKSGRELGGTSVTITGTNFAGVTAVKFGSTEATSFKVNSPTSITAVSPAHTHGKVFVIVSTANGTSATSGKGVHASFKYT